MTEPEYDKANVSNGPWRFANDPATDGSCEWERIVSADGEILFEEYNNTDDDRAFVLESRQVLSETGLTPRELVEQFDDILVTCAAVVAGLSEPSDAIEHIGKVASAAICNPRPNTKG